MTEVVKQVSRYETEEYGSLNDLAKSLEALAKAKGGSAYTAAEKIVAENGKNEEKNPYVDVVKAVKYMREAAAALEIYENYK